MNPVFKKDSSNCENYRGTNFLIDEVILLEQSGFRKRMSYVNSVYALKYIIE
jgi:hypothetical protein